MKTKRLKTFAVTLVVRVVAKVIVQAASLEEADKAACIAAQMPPCELGQAEIVNMEFTEVLPRLIN